MRDSGPFDQPTLPRRALPSTLLIVGSALLAFWIGTRLNPQPAEGKGPTTIPPIAPAHDLWDVEQRTIDLFRRAAPSVVYVTTVSRRRQLFTGNVFEIPSGTGSGFIWSKNGHIVTNYHVVASVRRGDSLLVTLSDHSAWPAKVLGWAPEKDLAVLQIEADRDLLEALPIGTSRSLQTGQWVFAIGNPFGLDHTLTTGVISALGREIDSLVQTGDGDRLPIRDVIQTDAAINPGNSGGPLLDSSGRLVGVNTQIYSPSGASAGIGFAIPADTVRWVVPELIEHGRLVRPYLGIRMNDQVTRQAGIEGVLLVDVVRGSGAARAGLKPARQSRGRVILGDIITAIDGRTVETIDDVYLTLERYEAGDTVTLALIRDGEQIQVPVTLTARPR